MGATFSTDDAKSLWADADDSDLVSLHTGSPGTDGTANEVSGSGYTKESVTFGSASAGVRANTSDILFNGPAETTVTHAGLWKAGAPNVFRHWIELDAPVDFDADNEALFKAGQLTLSGENPV